MYNLFSKFYCRERETTCDEELKKYNTKTYKPKIKF